jgi:hypothetical protein
MLSILVLLLFGALSTVNAEIIETGEWAVYQFDFSSDAATPPYYGYNLLLTYDQFVSPYGLGYFHMTIDDKDNCLYGYTGECCLVLDCLGHREEIPFYSNSWDARQVLERDELYILTNEDMMYGQVVVPEGQIRVKKFELSMIGRDIVSGDFSTQTVEGRLIARGAEVPEPTTMLLLCSGLVGLLGFGRKKFKKLTGR